MGVTTKNIFVIGSVNQDIVVKTDNNIQPGHTKFGKSLEFFPGGKGANQAVAASLLGAKVVYIGKTGRDVFGISMKNYLKKFKLNENLKEDPVESTGTAIIIVDSKGENSILVIPGANGTLSLEDCKEIDKGKPGDLLLLQNEIPIESSCKLLQIAKGKGMTTCFNAAPAVSLPKMYREYLDYAIVNEHEYEIFFDKKIGENEKGYKNSLLQTSENEKINIVLTLGENGVAAAIDNCFYRQSAYNVKAVDTTGAGDCFIGAFCYGLSIEKGFDESLKLACMASAISVTKMGASASFPDLNEINSFF